MAQQPSERVDGSPLITISVKTLDAKVLKVQIDRNKTVLELKELLSSQCNLPAHAQRLIFKGKVLKDDQTLASYAIDEGFALHLVERPPGAPAPAAAGAAAPPAASARASTQPSRANVPPSAGFVPTVLIGNINLPPGTLPDMPGLAHATEGATAAVAGQSGTVPAAPESAPDTLDPLRQSLDQLQAAIGRVPAVPTASASAPSAVGAPASQMANLAAQLRSLSAHIGQLAPHIDRAAAVLAAESTLASPQQRQEAEQLVTSLGAALSALAHSSSSAGAISAQTRLGDATGKANILPVIRPRSASSISVSVPLFTMRRPDAAAAQLNAAAAPGAVPALAAGGVAPAANASQPAAPAQMSLQGLAPLFQMMGTILGASGRPAPSAPSSSAPSDDARAAQPAAAGAANVPAGGADPGIAGFMQMMGPALQQLSAQMSGQPASAPPAAAGTNAATRAPIPAAAPQRAVAPPAAAVNPPPPAAAAVPAVAPSSAAAPRTGGSQTAVMMSHMYTQLLNDLPRLTAPGAPPLTVQSFLSSMANVSDAPPDPNDVLSQLMRVILENLTLTELLEVSAGNWAPMERMHPPLRNQLLRSAAGPGAPAAAALPTTQPTPAQFARLADNMVASMKEAVSEEHLPEELKARILPGRELTSGSLSILRQKSDALLRIIAAQPGSHASSFAESLRVWSAGLVQELVSYLASSLRNGMADVGDVLRYFISERMSSLGEIAPFGAQLVTTYVLNTYAASMPQQPSTAPPSPLPAPVLAHIDADPNSWAPIIAQDEVAQMNMPPQPPHSEAYRAGAPGAKKRKSRAAATPDAQLADRVRGAGKRVSKAKKKEASSDDDQGEETQTEVLANAAAESTLLVELYRELLDRALKERESKSA